MEKLLKANIWKYFLLILTNRRNYIPLLSIYFLTLPNATAQQIGLYTAIGWIVGFLLEIPSGYFADTFGHKKTLFLAKIAFIFSTLAFSFGTTLPFFILGSACISIGFAFTSGTGGAFLHNTLVELKREKEYGKLSGEIRAKASLASAVMILLLPLLTQISLVMPIKLYLLFDIIGIITVLSLYSPKILFRAQDVKEKLVTQIKRFKGTGFYPMSIFLGLLSGFIMSQSPFRTPYVEQLGLPIIFIGFIMAASRVIWFIVGHNLKWLKKIPFKAMIFYEIFFFSGLTILSSQLTNPYIVGGLLAIVVGYMHGRSSLVSEYYLNNFLVNQRYKATMLSIKSQVSKLFDSGIAFAIGFVMAISFSVGFLVLGVAMFVSLVILYPTLKEKKK